MCALVSMIEPKQFFSIFKPSLKLAVSLKIKHQLEKHDQKHIPETLTFAKTPILIASRQKISQLKIGGPADEVDFIRF